MVKKDANRQNIYFVALVLVSSIIFISFIIATVSMVFFRGMSNLVSSIMAPEIQFSMKLSFITSSISTTLCLLFAIPVAYGLSRFKFRGKTIVSIILSIPMALPPLVSGVALLLLFGTTAFGKALEVYGIKIVFTPLGIIVAQFFTNAPYLIKILKNIFDSIDSRMEFVARTLGNSRLQAFYTVTLPLARNGIIAGIVITWARSLGEFGAMLMLAGATRMKTDILPVSLYLNMSTGELNLALASASILIIMSILCLLFFELLGGSKYQVYRNNI